MLRDGRQVPDGTILEADVCILGAGAAGMTLARELAGGPLDVLVLESGGLAADPETQALYRGRVVGRPYYRLDESRTRRFGGSTHCWAGMCRPLAAQDFEARDWIPESGWPVSLAELRPYYERAQRVCRLAEFDYAAERWSEVDHMPPALRDDAFDVEVFQIAPHRFAGLYGAELERARNVTVHLHANAVDLVAAADGTRVERIEVATLAGTRFAARARRYIVAAGGIENARLLLASRGVHATGLGNRHDLVGRYFMEHPHVVSGTWLPSAARETPGFFRPRAAGDVSIAGCLVPSARTQREELIASFAVFLARDAGLSGFEEPLARFVAQMDGGEEPARGAILFMNEVEQAPNPDSRVRLVGERDALGMPLVQLEWRLSALDKRTLRRGHELLARSLGHAGLGRLQVTLDDDDHSWPPDLGGGRHHMGTTRMHFDPKRGVVDANCRVHDLANLYVAGSSVFPTSGSANPTLTIVALALRLADHVSSELR